MKIHKHVEIKQPPVVQRRGNRRKAKIRLRKMNIKTQGRAQARKAGPEEKVAGEVSALRKRPDLRSTT